MWIKNFSLVLFTFFVFIFSQSQAVASGGDDYSSDDESSVDNLDAFGSERERVVDPTYESGKAVYTGRSAPKLSYCVKVGDEIIKVKRKSIKEFKQKSYSDLAKNLYRCDDPNQAIRGSLEKQQFLHVLYYLNKRYKLNLSRAWVLFV